MPGLVLVASIKPEVVLNTEEEDESEGPVGRVEKGLVGLSYEPVAKMIPLAPSPEPFHSIIWPFLAALGINILLMLVVYVYWKSFV